MDSRDISKPQPGIQLNQQILVTQLSLSTLKDQLKGQNQRPVNQPSAYASMPNKDVPHPEQSNEMSHEINPRNVIDLEEINECEPEIADPEKAIPLGCGREMNVQEKMQKQQQGQIVNYQQPINPTQTQICKASTFIDLSDDRIQQQQPILNQQKTLKAQHEPIKNNKIAIQVPILNKGQMQVQPQIQQQANPIQVMTHEQTIAITTIVSNPNTNININISNESILPQAHQIQIKRVNNNNVEQTVIATDQVDQNRGASLDEHVQMYDQLNQTPVFQQSRFHIEDNQHNQNFNILQRTAHTVQQNIFSPDQQFLRPVVFPQLNQNANQINNSIQQNSINIPTLSRLQTTHQSQQSVPIQRQQTQNLTVNNNEQAQVTSLNSAIQSTQNVNPNSQIQPECTQMNQQLCIENRENSQNKNQINAMREQQGMQMEQQRQMQSQILESNMPRERQPDLQPGQIAQKETQKQPVIPNQQGQITHQNENQVNENNQIIVQPQPAQGEPCMFGQSPQLTDINQIRNMLLTNLPPHLQQLTLTLDDKQLRQMYLDIRAQQTRLAQQQQKEAQSLNKKSMKQQPNSNLIDVDSDSVIQNNQSEKSGQKPKKQSIKPSQQKKSFRIFQQQQSKANQPDQAHNPSSPSPNSQSHSQSQAGPKAKISSKRERKRVVTTIVQQIEYLEDSDSHNERPSKCVVLDNGQVKRKKNHSNRNQMQAILGQLCTLVKSLDLSVLNSSNSNGNNNGNNSGNGGNQNQKQ